VRNAVDQSAHGLAFAAQATLLRCIISSLVLAAALLSSASIASAQIIGRGGGPDPLIPIFTTFSSIGSVQSLAGDRQGLIVTNRVLTSILGGFNEQINCTTCISAFGEIGSFSAGAHGRKALTEDLSVLGGIAYSNYRSGAAHVTGMPLGAGSLRYDFTELGASRPYLEAGGVLAPSGHATFTRHYGFGAVDLPGSGSASTTNYAVFGRAGWVYRFTPIDEASAAAELSHNWQRVGAYSEGLSPLNPVPLVNGGGTDEMNIAKIGGQLTHLVGTSIETQINLGVAHSFGSRSGLAATLSGAAFKPTLGEYTWGEFGARVGYRIQPKLILDVFADGTVGPRPIGATVHGGLAVRYTF
jgi:fibronectin-binding autotransporter adhesin